MRWVIALSALAIVGTAASSVGVAFWTGHLGHHDFNLRAIHYDTQRTIHYDTQYDLSARRRDPAR
jgi:hypothetical protein